MTTECYAMLRANAINYFSNALGEFRRDTSTTIFTLVPLPFKMKSVFILFLLVPGDVLLRRRLTTTNPPHACQGCVPNSLPISRFTQIPMGIVGIWVITDTQLTTSRRSGSMQNTHPTKVSIRVSQIGYEYFGT